MYNATTANKLDTQLQAPMPRTGGVSLPTTEQSLAETGPVMDHRSGPNEFGEKGHEPTPIAILRELAQLRQDGIITADEFEVKKAEILGRI